MQFLVISWYFIVYPRNIMYNYNSGGKLKMRIIICDDDEIFSEKLHQLLMEYFKKNGLFLPDFKIFNCGEDLLADKGAKDIIFLDIEMSGLNGIYVGNEIKKRSRNAIIFIVTSFIEYLDDAMRFHVFRYLSKPIEKYRLFSNMNDALHLYLSRTTMIPIETKEGVISVTTNDIIMIESNGRKTIVHTSEGDYLSLYNLNYWSEKLPSQNFFRTHRSFIVNLAHINQFDHNSVYLFKRQFTAYLARRKYTNFKDAYLLYLESTR